MKSPRFAPTAVAVAVLFASAPLIGSVGATAIAGKPAAFAPAAPAVAAKAATGKVVKISLRTGMADGKMVFLDAQGKPNPVLRGNVGDTLEISIASGEGAEHDIVFPELKVQSPKFDGRSGAVKVVVPLAQAGKFSYFCSIPGHKQIGMEGVLEVAGPAGAPQAAAPAKATQTMGAAPAIAPDDGIAPAATGAATSVRAAVRRGALYNGPVWRR